MTNERKEELQRQCTKFRNCLLYTSDAADE